MKEKVNCIHTEMAEMKESMIGEGKTAWYTISQNVILSHKDLNRLTNLVDNDRIVEAFGMIHQQVDREVIYGPRIKNLHYTKNINTVYLGNPLNRRLLKENEDLPDMELFYCIIQIILDVERTY